MFIKKKTLKRVSSPAKNFQKRGKKLTEHFISTAHIDVYSFIEWESWCMLVLQYRYSVVKYFNELLGKGEKGAGGRGEMGGGAHTYKLLHPSDYKLWLNEVTCMYPDRELTICWASTKPKSLSSSPKPAVMARPIRGPLWNLRFICQITSINKSVTRWIMDQSHSQFKLTNKQKTKQKKTNFKPFNISKQMLLVKIRVLRKKCKQVINDTILGTNGPATLTWTKVERLLRKTTRTFLVKWAEGIMTNML